MLFKHPHKLSYEGDFKKFEDFFEQKVKEIQKGDKKEDLLDLIFEYLGSDYKIGSFFSGFRLLVDIFSRFC